MQRSGEQGMRKLAASIVVLTCLSGPALARPTDDQAWSACHAWALSQLKASPAPVFSSVSMQNSKQNFVAVFFAVDTVDSAGKAVREYGRCLTDGSAIEDFSSVGGDTEPIVKAWVLDTGDPRRRRYTPPPD